MEIIDTALAIGRFFRSLRFTIARLLAKSPTRDLAPAHLELLARGRTLRDAHEEAEEATEVATAGHVGEKLDLGDAIEALGRAVVDAAARGGDETLYAKLFKVAPSRVARLDHDKMDFQIGRMLGVLHEAGSPFPERTEAIEAAWARETETRKAAGVAAADEATAQGAINAWKEDVNAAQRSIDAALTLRAPRNRRWVRSFFKQQRSRRRVRRVEGGEAKSG